jgi:tripartite-type tricarboxylate transporter receptor subunit TctC
MCGYDTAMRWLVALLVLTASHCWAQYPSRPVRLIVGFVPGGATDIVARIMAQWLTERLGHPVVVENKPGAGSNIAAQTAINSPPDGYTLLFVSTASAINATFYEQLPFNFLRDVAPVAALVRTPNVIVVHPSLPVRTVADFIAYAKANPGKLNYAAPGGGSQTQLAAEWLKILSATKMTFVPYKGSAPAVADLVAGHVDLMFNEGTGALPYVLSHQIKTYAVLANTRWFAAPDVPTSDELGVPGINISFWHGLWVPTGTPQEVVNKLNAAVAAALADATVRKRLTDIGQEIVTRDKQTPEALHVFHKAEIEKWWPIIKGANIRAESR